MTFQIRQIYANVDFCLFLYEGFMKDFVYQMGFPPGSDSEMEEERELLFHKLQDSWESLRGVVARWN